MKIYQWNKEETQVISSDGCEKLAAALLQYKETGAYEIGFVGAGGKSSLLYALAQFYAPFYRTLVMTSTQIHCPEWGQYATTEAKVKALWEQGRYAVIGAYLENEKIGPLAIQDRTVFSQQAEIILVEADGAKGKWCKVPSTKEPVIWESMDIIVAVIGMQAIGSKLKERCFRLPELTSFLKVTASHRLTVEEVARIITHPSGGRKCIGKRPFFIIGNQCDTTKQLKQAVRLQLLLEEKGEKNIMFTTFRDGLIVVRGAGDIATGVLYTLYQHGYRVLALETESPSAIRRQVSFSEAVYEGSTMVEGVTSRLVTSELEMKQAWDNGDIPVCVDACGEWIQALKPQVVIDAILAKKNLGTSKEMAPLVVALGPGFQAGEYGCVDVVIETMRGSTLGQRIYDGETMPNTGKPGPILGFDKERVIHASVEGVLYNKCKIGDVVNKGQVIAQIKTSNDNYEPVYATIPGILKGLIRDRYPVHKGFKIADIDPRLEEKEQCFYISDKAKCIGESVARAVAEGERRML